MKTSMKMFASLAVLLLSVLCMPSRAQLIGYAQSYGAALTEKGNGVVRDLAGNVLVIGSFSSAGVSFDGIYRSNTGPTGTADVFVAKVSPLGNVYWIYRPAGIKEDIGKAICLDESGDVYITGSFESPTLTFGSWVLTNSGVSGTDIFYAKLNGTTGNPVWAQGVASGNYDHESGNAICCKGGVLFITGNFDGSMLTFPGSVSVAGSGGSCVCVANFASTTGTCLWADSFTGTLAADDAGTGIDADNSGNCYVTGYFRKPVLSSGTPGFALYNTDITGATADLFIVKYSPIIPGTSGAMEISWAKNPAGTLGDAAYGIAVNPDGTSIFVTGSFEVDSPSGSLDFGSGAILSKTGVSFLNKEYFLAKYSGSGSIYAAEWAATADANYDPQWNFDDEGLSVATDESGNAYVTGYYKSNRVSFGAAVIANATNNNYAEVFITKYSGSGNLLFAYSPHEVFDDYGTSIDVDQYGCLAITGNYDDDLAFGATLLTNMGESDALLTTICTPDTLPEPLPCCPTPSAGIITGNSAIGSIDPSWNITLPSGSVVPATSTFLHPAFGWGLPLGGTNWISVANPPTAVSGTYVYETSFTMDSCFHPEICLYVQVDDTADVYLNGNFIGRASSESIPALITDNNPAHFYAPGTNILSVSVINHPAIFVGLDIKGWVCCPEPEIVPVNCGDSVCGNNFPDTHFNLLDGYPCGGLVSYSAPEAIYSVTMASAGHLSGTFSSLTSTAGLDLFLLTNPSDPASCHGYAGTYGTGPVAFSFFIPLPGTYYLVVDGRVSSEYTGTGQFCMTIACDTITGTECEPECSDPVVTLHTGLAPIGSPDPNWMVTPPGGTASPAVSTSLAFTFGWGASLTGTNWISTVNPPSVTTTGVYEFERSFYLDSCLSPFLKLCVMVDDTALVFLNGNLIGTATSENIPAVITDYNPAHFNPGGTNLLRILVINDPGVKMGLDVKGWVCCQNRVIIPVICDDTICSNNNPGTHLNLLDGYPCGDPASHSAPEAVYSITMAAAGTLAGTFSTSTGEADLDLFLLTDPSNPGSCLNCAGTYGLDPFTFSFPIPGPGTYYLVVDGRVSSEYDGIGQFCMTLACDEIPGTECEPECSDPLVTLHTGLAPVGSPDPYWTVTPPGGTASPSVSTSLAPVFGWGAAFTGTHWISTVDPPVVPPIGVYEFQRSFYLDSCLSPALKLCIMVDDTAVLILNGHLIGEAASKSIPAVITDNDPTHFNTGGMNLLRIIVVNNPGGNMGLNVKGWVCCGDSVPVIRLLSGKVSYDNAVHDPLPNTMLLLKQDFVTLDTAFTNAEGDYNFGPADPGCYYIEAQTGLAWGGVNASDALLALKHFVGMEHLAGLRYWAADVDGSGNVNAADALSIAKRFTGIISSFTIRDWLFEEDTFCVTLPGLNIHNFRGICAGDVTGDYSPSLRRRITATVGNTGEIMTVKDEFTEIPVRIEAAGTVSAISLVVQLPENVRDAEVAGPEESGQGEYFTAQVDGNQLRIAWFSLEGRTFSDNEAWFRLLFRATGLSAADLDPFMQVLYEEFVDNDLNRIENATIAFPKLTKENSQFTFDVFPNPAPHNCAVTFETQENCKVKAVLYNQQGEQVSLLASQLFGTGIHQIILDRISQAPGIYLLRIEVEGKTLHSCSCKKIVFLN